jgi:membrane-associated phospholipid phosphatase
MFTKGKNMIFRPEIESIKIYPERHGDLGSRQTSHFRGRAGILLLALAIGVFPGATLFARAEDEPGAAAHHFNGRYLGKVAVDFGKVFVSPIHWKGKDFLNFGVAAGSTVLVMALGDHGVREWVEDHQKTSYTNSSLFISHLGEMPFLIGLSAVLYGGGEAFKNDGLRETGLLCLESYAIGGAIVTGIKYIFARARPLSGEGEQSFHWFSFKNREHAMPSGHACAAFSVASVIAGRSDSVLVGALSYGLASLVAISRVNNNEHWLSDVVAGSFLGYFIGKKILALNRPAQPGRPTLSFGGAPGGFALSLRF